MNELKDYSSESDFYLHLNFHLIGDLTYKSQKNEVEKHLNAYFNSRWLLEYEDPEGSQNRELVYQIREPLIADPDVSEKFFQSLKEFFEVTRRFLPSFIQTSEAVE